MNQPKLLRVDEACEILNIKRMTFYNLVNRGQLGAINLNEGTDKKKRYRVPLSAIDTYIRTHQNNLSV